MIRMLLIAIVFLTVGGPSPVSADVPRGPASKVSVDLALVESSGATLAERKIELAVGGTETVSVPLQQGRAVTIETTLQSGSKAGCFKIALVVRDRRIDSTGHFNKTVWQSATEPCDADPILLGPKEETRVRVAVRRRG